MSGHFTLDDRLAADTVFVADLGLSRLLMMKDARWHWLVLVPQLPDLVELTDLDRDNRINLLDEIDAVSRVLTAHLHPTKINVAALGNMVRQLHVHVIARFDDDPAWPGPIWGVGEPVPLTNQEAAARIEDLRTRLS